jgi:hypothetical protein
MSKRRALEPKSKRRARCPTDLTAEAVRDISKAMNGIQDLRLNDCRFPVGEGARGSRVPHPFDSFAAA